MGLYSPLFMRWKMKTVKDNSPFDFPVSLQEEFAGVEARVESLRGRNSVFEPREAGRQVNGLFESLLSEAFN